MSEYTDCYVAFLDILGFKNLLKDDSCEAIKRIFKSLIDYKPRPLMGKCEAFKSICYYIMSDSIVIYIDSSVEDAFMALTEVCLQIQIRLTTLDTPVLLRGAIAKGPLYCEEHVIFGQGLSDAYILENTLAKYPRVIFTDSVRQVALHNTRKQFILDYNPLFYKRDDDRLFYLDYLNTFDYLRFIGPISVSDYIDYDKMHYEKLFCFIEEGLGVETNPSIREKYLWLRNKLLLRIDQLPEVKKHFEELDHKLEEERKKRLEETIKEVFDNV